MKGNEQIVVEYALPAPPQQVWRTLTEPNLLAIWLMASDIVPLVGHKFKFRSEPRGDWNGIVDCQVLEVDPDARLAYTWNGGSNALPEGGYKMETTVTWTLEEAAGGGTLLKLVHHGFHPDDGAFAMLNHGWRSKGPGIEKALAAISEMEHGERLQEAGR